MLESLTIRNYAIIDEMTTDFSAGLNIITGETGAGKSIVVDALELVLGARASVEMIRAGASSLEVSGMFSADKRVWQDLLPLETDENTLILRRIVRSDGNNRCYINDHPVTLRLLKEAGDRLVDFHGQHDHQSLLFVAEHVTFLDGYAGLSSASLRVRRLYEEMTDIRVSLEKRKKAIASAERDRDLYTFQRDEIEKARLIPGEDAELDASIRRLASAGELKELGWRIFNVLSEDEGSVAERLGEMATYLESMAEHDAELKPALEKILELIENVADIAGFCRGYAERIEDDPAFLDELEERLALIERLKKKYGPTLEDVFAYHEKIKRELEKTEHSEAEYGELEKKLKDVQALLTVSARELSVERRKAAPRLSGEVESHLAELGMEGSRLVIEIRDCSSGECIEGKDGVVHVTANGSDDVEFMISANPGEPPRPLVKVASGGEISRIMLSLKLALVDANLVPTMVFDEIDVGVSGRIAESIGKKLMNLTRKRQALVITHLPQIAAMGVRHFSARKTVEGDRTYARLVELDEKMRQEELASLLSGETLSETALAHARELMVTGKKQRD